MPSAARVWHARIRIGSGETNIARPSDEPLICDVDASHEIGGPVCEFLSEVLDKLLAVAFAPRGRIPPKKAHRTARVVNIATHAKFHERLRRDWPVFSIRCWAVMYSESTAAPCAVRR